MIRLEDIPKSPVGYRCGGCNHFWEGFTTPCTVDEMRAHAAEHGACPACGERKTLIVPNAVYAREKETVS